MPEVCGFRWPRAPGSVALVGPGLVPLLSFPPLALSRRLLSWVAVRRGRRSTGGPEAAATEHEHTAPIRAYPYAYPSGRCVRPSLCAGAFALGTPNAIQP